MEGKKTIIGRIPVFGEHAHVKSHASLIVLKGAEIGRDFRLRKASMVIGRSRTADVFLPDNRVSREHARIDRPGQDEDAPAGFILTDLGSTNGTFVNSQRVESVLLSDGDKIGVGDSILKFVLLDEIEASFHAEVRDLISFDQLTGLLTKESLYLAFERELERCLRYGLKMGVLMMDLDRFKSVNDTYGHLMGSHVLAEVGQIIRDAIRNDDVSARYGGEEFISYLVETDMAGLQLAAERIRRGVEDHTFVLGDQSVRITISIGIAEAPAHGDSTNALVAAADRALYQAKETGRNRVCVATSS
jgi:two-component system, cell cycle response regulator